MSKNNPIESAKEAAFKEDIRAYQDELNMYITKEYQMLAGQRDSKITATGYEKDSTSEEYNNSVYKYLSSFKKKYENKIAIENDEIVYIGRDKKEREWTNNIVKMNPMLTVKYVYENGEEAAPTYEEIVINGTYEVDSPMIDGYEPDYYTVSDKIEKDTEVIVTYYPWSEGLAYEELEDGSYTISGKGTFAGENLVIPRKYNEKKVTEIKSLAFYQCTNIKKIVISNNIQKIGEDSFHTCRGISEVVLGKNVKKIDRAAFCYCYGIEKVVIGDGLENISDQLFWSCSNIKTVKIGKNVKSINKRAFYGCNLWTEIILDQENNNYKLKDNILYSLDEKSIKLVPTGIEGNFEVNDNITSIGDSAFAYCTKLTYIDLGKNTLNIGELSLASCSGLTSIKIGNKINRIGHDCFHTCSNLKSIIMEDCVKVIDDAAFCWCNNLKEVTISKNISSIGALMFYGDNKLQILNYNGTKEEWNNIAKNSQWKSNSAINSVKCKDGVINLE